MQLNGNLIFSCLDQQFVKYSDQQHPASTAASLTRSAFFIDPLTSGSVMGCAEFMSALVLAETELYCISQLYSQMYPFGCSALCLSGGMKMSKFSTGPSLRPRWEDLCLILLSPASVYTVSVQRYCLTLSLSHSVSQFTSCWCKMNK